MGETSDTTRSGQDEKSSRPCSLANDSSSRRAAFPPTAWKPGRRSSGEATRGSSPGTKPPPIWAAEPGPGSGSSVAMGTGREARTEQPATPCSSVWSRAAARCRERSRSSHTQSQRSRSEVRTVPRDRRVPQANRGRAFPTRHRLARLSDHFTASRPLDLVRELPRHHARARRRGVVGEDSQPTDLHVARRYPRLVAHESQQRLLKTGGRVIPPAPDFTLHP